MNRRPQLQIVAPNASPSEAAAIVSALEQFMRDTAPPAGPVEKINPWLRTALFEGVDRENDGLTAWGDSEPWGN